MWHQDFHLLLVARGCSHVVGRVTYAKTTVLPECADGRVFKGHQGDQVTLESSSGTRVIPKLISHQI